MECTEESFKSSSSPPLDMFNIASPPRGLPFAMMKTDDDVCYGCGLHIADRFLLKVNDQSWHVQCLRCCVCHVALDRQNTCFMREDNIYCRLDYAREFGAKCAKCFRSIQPTDWVRRAREHVYHLACFACDTCKRQLSTGEEFALHGSKVLCKPHYLDVLEGGPHKDSDASQKTKTKRVRTTFTEEQIQVLQANFQLDSNPDGQDLERIAQITGLSKRVTQVWFQNSRARQKKQQQQHTGNHSSPGSLTSQKMEMDAESVTPDVFHIAVIAVFPKMQRSRQPLYIVGSSLTRTCQRSRL
ncbi:LIM/homeobox protein Awh-like [Dreissena polymorpha]|uniref:LIM/homeobox protein Awh-like n=1 Tax=Dreissena polymorpha TaxID=45954 RepID=UPI002264DCDA|nr:LIM/homeobox protein Awh-like [Dreissena polymorpha]